MGVNIDGRNKKEADNSVLSALGTTVLGGEGGEAPKAVRRDADGAEIDENGLPVGRDWYYYDTTLGRYNVKPDAPAHIREENARQVAAYNAEQEGTSKASLSMDLTAKFEHAFPAVCPPKNPGEWVVFLYEPLQHAWSTNIPVGVNDIG